MSLKLSRPAGLVSIIVPVFNGETYIRESLDSILSQSYSPIEILVMDDGSTDGTPAILDSYRDRVRVHTQKANRGIYGNANDGIAMVRGEYIAVYHADDVYSPDMVKSEVEFLKRYDEAGAVFSSMTYIDPSGREFGSMLLPAEIQGDVPQDYRQILNALLLNTNHILMCPTAMVRASVYDDVGVYNDRDFRNTADLEMWLRIARKYPIGVLAARLLRYRRFHDCSSLRYHRLRTEPGRHFQIMDLYLTQSGKNLASRNALAAHEAHRAQDLMFAAISNYILDRVPQARALLSRTRPAQILASPKIQRGRMLFLWVLLRVLLRIPRSEVMVNIFRSRWHDNAKAIAKATGKLGKNVSNSDSAMLAGAR